jgi:hypothetical protein
MTSHPRVTMTGTASSGFADLDHLADLFHRTRALLDVLLATGDLPDGGSDLLTQETLPHIEDVEAGFRSSLRTAEGSLVELRQLILQGGLGLPEPRSAAEERAALIEAMRARSGAGGAREVVAAPSGRRAALEHARLTLAMLPATAPAEVRFPEGRRTYADIPAPRSPSEFAARVEEIERTVWRLAAGGRPRTHDGPTRRVYGFFDAGERLTLRGLRLD